MIRLAVVVVTAVAAMPSAAMAAATPAKVDNSAAVKKVVAQCVETTHADGYNHFDAFYNTASGAVENNVLYVADQGALFIFDKCMAEAGYPLVMGK
jgi:hypothetical protein